MGGLAGSVWVGGGSGKGLGSGVGRGGGGDVGEVVEVGGWDAGVEDRDVVGCCGDEVDLGRGEG